MLLAVYAMYAYYASSEVLVDDEFSTLTHQHLLKLRHTDMMMVLVVMQHHTDAVAFPCNTISYIHLVFHCTTSTFKIDVTFDVTFDLRCRLLSAHHLP